MNASRIKQTRLDMELTTTEMAKRMGVALSTISNWESGRFPIPEKKLVRLAEISGCSLAYLRGEDSEQVNWIAPIDSGNIPVLHRCPVWSAEYGWGLMNAVTRTMVLADSTSIPLQDLTAQLYGIPPTFSLPLFGFGNPLNRHEMEHAENVWVEPISTDDDLRAELRGWYHVKMERFVENEFGNRFYFDTYLAKWAAFSEMQNE